ncbi:fungal-specific transcription factor domain-containing protein [Colletotrichum sublineola]|uniref:Putative fungal specific transcription factor domain-containing protein n=1 Tax=Colletotrichum sublineola TaxID=1173701 RepID=A0A066WVP3_COLSU|nr:fungal-specific transcription factor domain-containing protein [Colletotrichum sublineola]KDN60707.1 putative fungal specific transcription factor domain-containing protein [Colletotrichum sublineola]
MAPEPDVTEAVTPQSTVANSASAQKRTAPGSASGESQRSKRAKYTPVACNECKRRKLKCIKEEGRSTCRRCLMSGGECVFVLGPQQTPLRGRELTFERDEPINSYDARSDAAENHSMLTAPTGSQYKSLSDEVAVLREQVATLTSSLRELTGKIAHVNTRSPAALSGPPQPSPLYVSESTSRPSEPREPQFVGPTRSAYSLRIAESSLSRVPVQARDASPTSRSASPAASARAPSEVADRHPSPSSAQKESPSPLLTLGFDEVVRLLDVYKEEIESVYPFTDIKDVLVNLAYILDYAGNPRNPPAEDRPEIELKDVQIVKVAIATSIVMEAQGQNAISTKLIDEVEPVVCCISGDAFIDLKELQIMTMLSIYWFHCGEELLAWRSIGISGREVLEIGLHRRAILMENFKDPKQRDRALRCFWCVYVLDRRWSFGTSLSFGIVDSDIDPELPEPGDEYPYLRCMVAYARLCSKVWKALPPFESPSQFIPKDTVAFLDFMTLNWLSAIPEDLQIRHPRLGLAPRAQPRSMHRLRTLLYLRGNQIRMLIHRHHVLSTASIKADMQNAKLVTEIALDSIQVLVHLNDTSDIYARQQNAFNYFLMSALVVILLAVCHAPGVFTEPCKEPFLKAVQLVKGFSRHGHASRRLWKTIRSLLPSIKSLGLRSDADKGDAPPSAENGNENPTHARADETAQDTNQDEREGRRVENQWDVYDASHHADASIPDMFKMGNDLLDLFDAFGHANAGHPTPSDFPVGFFGGNEHGMPLGGPEEISRRFQGLI